MTGSKRCIVIVLDSVGIGELPDAAEYGDAGSNTLLNIKKACPDMRLKNLNALGLSNISGAAALAEEPVLFPTGSFGKLAERSKGKDTTTGHWEIAGVLIEKALPLYPDGFPRHLLSLFETKIGRKTLGNEAASGTEIIERLGDEHVRTGSPIVYTSADSVFQIAMHESVIPVKEQYRICQTAREILTGDHAVARVIARPFEGVSGQYKRTANRRDFSLPPIQTTILDCIQKAGLPVAAVGKIEDIFAGRGVTQSIHINGDMDGVDKTLGYLDTVGGGLIFTNLVDFDTMYGHRNDARGYADALIAFDRRIPEILARLRPEDVLFITADHGCDPTTPSTDHSREYIPLLVYGQPVKPGVNLRVRESFADIGATVLAILGVDGKIHGQSFWREIAAAV
ncbi:MAG: phosphopentomutase [Clostridiales bacterium]|jgi:phosphopentomutase|nr:phosphopentomutase [Clostridiales bacterium]